MLSFTCFVFLSPAGKSLELPYQAHSQAASTQSGLACLQSQLSPASVAA